MKDLISSGDLTIQTDNGVEFAAAARQYENNYFTQAVESF